MSATEYHLNSLSFHRINILYLYYCSINFPIRLSTPYQQGVLFVNMISLTSIYHFITSKRLVPCNILGMTKPIPENQFLLLPTCASAPHSRV